MVSVHRETGSVILRLQLPRPVEVVWASLTDPRHVAKWWGDHVDLEARPGGWFVERWSNAAGRSVETVGRVTRFAPPTWLEMTWADEDWPVVTSVSLRLEAAPAGTWLTLEHSGWDRFPGSDGATLRDEHVAGWTRHLQSLEGYLVHGC